MKAIFCFSSFIVRLFVHFFSEREANSETFVLVVHAVSSETHTYTHARAAACWWQPSSCQWRCLVCPLCVLRQPTGLHAYYGSGPATLSPGCFSPASFDPGVHFHSQNATCLLPQLLCLSKNTFQCCRVLQTLKVGCGRGPLCRLKQPENNGTNDNLLI